MENTKNLRGLDLILQLASIMSDEDLLLMILSLEPGEVYDYNKIKEAIINFLELPKEAYEKIIEEEDIESIIDLSLLKLKNNKIIEEENGSYKLTEYGELLKNPLSHFSKYFYGYNLNEWLKSSDIYNLIRIGNTLIKLSKKYNNIIDRSEIGKELKNKGIPGSQVDEILRSFMNKGLIINTKRSYYYNVNLNRAKEVYNIVDKYPNITDKNSIELTKSVLKYILDEKKNKINIREILNKFGYDINTVEKIFDKLMSMGVLNVSSNNYSSYMKVSKEFEEFYEKVIKPFYCIIKSNLNIEELNNKLKTIIDNEGEYKLSLDDKMKIFKFYYTKFIKFVYKGNKRISYDPDRL